MDLCARQIRNCVRTIYTEIYNYDNDNSDTSDSNCSDILPNNVSIKKIHKSKKKRVKKRPILKRKVKGKVSRSEDAIASNYRAL